MQAIIETKRLILRQWRETDVAELAAINTDPQVMKYFPALKTFAETQEFINANKLLYHEVGYCFYAVELKLTGEFIGFVGIAPVNDLPCAPATEIGWRLATKYWGHGYATEAASAVIKHAFSDLGLVELVSFTAKSNKRSEAVMNRLGFTRSEYDDFEHPKIKIGHALRPHIFYRLTSKGWEYKA